MNTCTVSNGKFIRIYVHCFKSLNQKGKQMLSIACTLGLERTSSNWRIDTRIITQLFPYILTFHFQLLLKLRKIVMKRTEKKDYWYDVTLDFIWWQSKVNSFTHDFTFGSLSRKYNAILHLHWKQQLLSLSTWFAVIFFDKLSTEVVYSLAKFGVLDTCLLK